MSSSVYNNNNVNNDLYKSASNLVPTTAGTANSSMKMYRYQRIIPTSSPTSIVTNSLALPQQIPGIKSLSNGLKNNNIKARKYTHRDATSNRCDSSTGSISSNSVSSSSSSAPLCTDQSQSVQRRNARERNRVQQVNNSFSRLRQHIPPSVISDLTKGGGRGPHKKISKVDTLRIAVEYIRKLQDLLGDLNEGNADAATAAAVAAVIGSNVTLVNRAANGTSIATTSTTKSKPAINTDSVQSVAPSAEQYFNASLQKSTTTSRSPNPLRQATANLPLSALQQQQQLSRQQYPNHPLTTISLNTCTSSSSTATAFQLLRKSQMEPPISCHSPSSFTSNMSVDSGTFDAALPQLSPSTVTTTTTSQTISLSKTPSYSISLNDFQHQSSAAPKLAPHNVVVTCSSTSNSGFGIEIGHDQLTHLQLKFEPYAHFNLDEEECAPDDEELLEYISLWQEEQT